MNRISALVAWGPMAVCAIAPSPFVAGRADDLPDLPRHDAGYREVAVGRPPFLRGCASARRLYLRAAVGSDVRPGPRFHYVRGGPGIALVRLNGHGK